MGKEMSDEEWQKKLENNYKRNSKWAKKGDYMTTLDPAMETAFRRWIMANNVPFNINAPVSDYDMRGFFMALMNKDPRAMSAVNPYDNKIHYPDVWKTPYHETFSAQSQWADKGAPDWNKQQTQLVTPQGQVLFDITKQAQQ